MLQPMHEPSLLLAALKAMLKERGVGYTQLAAELGVSLLTVKRSLNKPSLPLDRLLEICRIAAIEPVALVQRASKLHPSHTYFTPEQDEAFANCRPLLAYFTALQEGRTPRQIAEQHNLTAASTQRYLDELTRVGLVAQSGREVEVSLEPPVGFPPGSRTLGLIAGAFLEEVVARVVAAEHAEGDLALLKPLHLTERQYRAMLGELREVVDRYAFLSESSRPHENEAIRTWQLALAASAATSVHDEAARIRNLKPGEVGD